MACIMVSSPGVGGEGEGTTTGDAVGAAARDDVGNGGCGGIDCFCGDMGSCDSSFSEIEAGDEGRDKDAIGEAEDSASSALGVALGVGVNATGVPKDDEEDLDKGLSAAAAAAPGKTGGGGGTTTSDTSGNVGNSPKSGNIGTFGMFNFVIDCLVGAEGAETREDVEDVEDIEDGDDIIVGVKLNIVEG